jgi:hypothetical protein
MSLLPFSLSERYENEVEKLPFYASNISGGNIKIRNVSSNPFFIVSTRFFYPVMFRKTPRTNPITVRTNVG